MLFVYPAIFHKEDESYWVEFPDLKGCQTYGGTLNERAVSMGINFSQVLQKALMTKIQSNRR